jgi:hypothetical protein
MDGVATCEAGKCGFGCPGKMLCGNVCVATTQSCKGACAAGKHDCNGNCVSDTDVATCGKSCAACPVPANGMASCNGTVCSFTCNAGYHKCGTLCLADSSVMSCGKSCTACPVPANGMATCNGTVCGIMCGNGFHLCGMDCADNKSPASCGARCTVCDAPVNAHPTCDGTNCGYECDRNVFACSDRSCLQQRWDFETPSTEGWQVAPASTVTAMPAGTSNTTQINGARSLAVDFTATAPGQNLTVLVPLCPGSMGTDVSGKLLTTHVNTRGPAVTSLRVEVLNVTDAAGTMVTTLTQEDNVKLFDWPAPTHTFPAGSRSFKIGIRVTIGFDMAAMTSWAGTVYIDSVSFR